MPFPGVLSRLREHTDTHPHLACFQATIASPSHFVYCPPRNCSIKVRYDRDDHGEKHTGQTIFASLPSTFLAGARLASKMKTLCLVRHAKSSWKRELLTDIDRPLNNQGMRDASLMGRVLRKKNIQPDLLLASPAKRAFDTSVIIAQELAYPADKIRIVKRLYLARIDEILMVIQDLDDHCNTAVLVGHNPGLTRLAELLVEDPISEIPTTGILCFDFAGASWKHIAPGSVSLRFFEYPKRKE